MSLQSVFEFAFPLNGNVDNEHSQFINIAQLRQLVHLAHASSSQSSDFSLLHELESLNKSLKKNPIDLSDPNWSTAIRLLACLLCDFSSSSSVHKLAIQLVKSLLPCDQSKAILPQFINSFEEILFGYFDCVLLGHQQEENDLENTVCFIEQSGRICDSFRSVFQLLNYSELTAAFLWKSLFSTITLDQRIRQVINSPACSESITRSSQRFATLSNAYHQQYKLANSILLRLLSTNDLNQETQIQSNRNQIQIYRQSIQETLNFAFPMGVVVESSLVIVRLQFVDIRFGETLNEVDLSAECLHSLVKYISEHEIQPKLSLPLISAFLIEANKALALLLPKCDRPQSDLSAIICHLINSWPCKSDSQFVYFTAMLYFNYTKFVLASLNLQNDPVDDSLVENIERTVQQIIEFAQNYWSYSSIEHVFDCLCNCLKIMCHIRNVQSFHQFLLQLYLQFYHSRNSLSVYRLLHLIQQSVPSESFEAVFKELIITQFTLQTSVEHFLYHSNIPTLDSLLDDEQEESEADQQLLATYQISNRNIDLVRFVGIRLFLMSTTQIDQLCCELTDLLSDKGSQLTKKFVLKSLLPKLLATIPLVFSTIQAMLIFLVRNDHIYSLKAELTIAIIRLNRQNNMHLFEDEANFMKTFISRVAIKHFDDEIRLEALTLLVEYKKSTQQLESLQTIFEMIISCSSIQQASVRDQLVKLFRKLFVRLDDSSRGQYKANPQILYDYSCFLMKLVQYCFDRLQLTAYFGALLTYLQVIKLFMETFQCQVNTKLKSPLGEHFRQQPFKVVESDFERLLSMMEHSFDEIKRLSQTIIVLFHRSGVYSLKDHQIEQISQRSNRLLTLIQPQATQTGVALYRMLTVLDPEQNFAKLNQLVAELQKRVKAIKSDLMSSVHSPCCPILATIRALLVDQLNSMTVCSRSSEWRSLIGNIITECMSACEAVSPIVCNDSPEGHLPMDRSEIQCFYNDTQQVDTVKQLYVTSQMLLLNGWMTVKESVLILSHLVASFPDHHCQPSLVECETARTVIDFLYENQLNLVHRGAFEQSSQAFNRLISSLWKHNCPQCCNKFEQFIAQIKTHLTSRNVNGQNLLRYKTITRRSAGLPLVIQSILSAEPASLGSRSHGAEFIGTLVNLLQPEQRPHAWQVVHSLNILKALIRDSRLVDALAPWLESTIRLCVHWFDKRNYAHSLAESSSKMAYSIQNCSSMLFSALVTRIFGVKRNRADTSRKNRMSSMLFFQSFPSLYSFFLEHTENAAKLSGENAKCDLNSLYPTLVILSRLIPTISENSLFEVSRFLVPLRQIAFKCRDSRLRSLAVLTYARLCSQQLLLASSYVDNFDALGQQLGQLVEQVIESKRETSANTLHGTGLLLSELVLQYSCHLEVECVQGYQTEATPINLDEQCALKSLLQIYNDSSRLLHHGASVTFSLPAPVLQSLYILHSRIYCLAMVAQWKSITSSNHCEILFSSVIAESSSMKQAVPIASDQLCVAKFMDTLVHCMLLEGNIFGNRLKQIASLKSDQCLDGKLLLWSFLNELLLLSASDSEKNSATFLLRRQHFSQETVFTREINELLCTVRRFDKAALLKHCLLPVVRSEHFQADMVRASNEWTHLVKCCRETTKQPLFASVQWDIVHEILRMMYNARRLGLIGSTIQFFGQLGIDQPHNQLLTILDQVKEDENAHYSLTLLAQICLCDNTDLTANSIDYHAYQTMCSHLNHLCQDASSVISRQASLYGVALSLRTWSKLFFELPSTEVLQNYNALQVVCGLFSSLLKLLQDEEKAIRQNAARVVYSLAKVGSVEVKTTSGEVTSKSNATSSLAMATLLTVAMLIKMLQQSNHQLGPFFLLQLTIDLFLEGVYEDQDELCDNGEEARLFDKSKLNTYSDDHLLVQHLLDQLATLIKGQLSCENSSESPLQHIELILRSLSAPYLPDSYLEELLEKVHQIKTLAANSQGTSRDGLGPYESNKFQNFLNKLKQVI